MTEYDDELQLQVTKANEQHMATNKTQQTDSSVEAFLATIADEAQRGDAHTLVALMQRLSGNAPRLWGPSIIGFGSYHYKYDSGREGTSLRIGFSPRKGQTVLYIMDGFPRHAGIMARLGKYKTGKSCLYIKRLSDVDGAVLEELCKASLDWMAKTYPD
jgi:Domain of unknown function (DU1801)